MASAQEQAVPVGEPDRSSTTKFTAPWLVIVMLFFVYLFNSIDRYIITVIAQPIKEELQLADWQLGLMTGFAFSFLYIMVGFPMARLADRKNRVNILSICVVAWSAMTALCGLSANFIQLCLYRMGVGIGEAGCLPTSHSIISDYFPPERRARALAMFGLGLPLGGLVGMLVGGYTMDLWGWRAAFFVVGIPGIIVALLTWLIVKEPIRGRFDKGVGGSRAHLEPGMLRDVAATLWKSPVSRHVIIALALSSFFGSASTVFLGPFLARKFELSYTEIGAIISFSFLLGSAISTLLGGLFADWAGRRDQRWYLWMPAIGVAISAPLYVAAYADSTWMGLAIYLFFASVVSTTYLAPCYAVLHNEATPGTRATTTVIAQFSITLIGQSLGPLLCGIAVDAISAGLFHDVTGASFLSSCPGGRAPADAAAGLDLICRSALVEGTQIVMISFLALKIWPAYHFFIAARHMKKQAVGADKA